MFVVFTTEFMQRQHFKYIYGKIKYLKAFYTVLVALLVSSSSKIDSI